MVVLIVHNHHVSSLALFYVILVFVELKSYIARTNESLDMWPGARLSVTFSISHYIPELAVLIWEGCVLQAESGTLFQPVIMYLECITVWIYNIEIGRQG